MNTIRRSHRSLGFTVVEMIGVLAVIAILASILIPVTLRTLEEHRGLIRSTNGVVITSTIILSNDQPASSVVYGVLLVTNCVLVTNPITGQNQVRTNVVPIVSRFTVQQDTEGIDISSVGSE